MLIYMLSPLLQEMTCINPHGIAHVIEWEVLIVILIVLYCPCNVHSGVPLTSFLLMRNQFRLKGGIGLLIILACVLLSTAASRCQGTPGEFSFVGYVFWDEVMRSNSAIQRWQECGLENVVLQ